MKYYFWIDTETTGLKAELNQILEYAVIVEDSLGNQVETLEVKLKLRPFVKPSAEALAANNIDPYSQDWINGATSEENAADQLASLCEKYTVNGVLPIFIAYNAKFDLDHVRMMFKRHGILLDNCFHPIPIDPLKLVKDLVSSKKIETRLITKGKKSYNSSKLEDVAKALNLTTGKPAHRALNDVETLILVTREIYRLATNKDLYSLGSNPDKYSFGETLNVLTNSADSGLKKRHIKIIENNIQDKKIVAFDLSDYERIGLSPSNIRNFNYYTILDELPLDEDSFKKIEDVFSSNLDYIKEKTELIKTIRAAN